MEPASLFRDKPASEQRALTIFRAEMIAREEANWRDLFDGFGSLKVITYSSGLDIILELAGMFADVEVTFGSERILSREHAALEQASGVVRGYTFLDAVSDQKAFQFGLSRHQRVAAATRHSLTKSFPLSRHASAGIRTDVTP